MCLAIVVVLTVGCGKQNAKWTFARAMNLADAGQLEEAIDLMQTALKMAPDDGQIKLNLANLLAENGQGELGIGHCDEYLETNPNDQMAHQIRSTCLQYLGRFDESLCDYKRFLSGRVSRTAIERNNLAYCRGLARKELTKAALDIQKAIESEEGEYWGSPYIVPLQVRTAVSAGLIARHIDRHDNVLRLLNRKIEQYEQKFGIQESLIKSLITQTMQDQAFVDDRLDVHSQHAISEDALFQLDLHEKFPFDEKLEKILLNARGIREIEKNSLALMLATRALIHEDRNCHRSADRDRIRIQELGFEFAKLASELPNDEACLATFRKASLFLDTRGFVSGRRSWKGEIPLAGLMELASMGGQNLDQESMPVVGPSSYEEALEDLDFAVLAAEIMELALNSSLFNSPDFSAQNIARRKKMATRMTAVLLYHRMEVHLRAGQQEAAEADQRSIECLGFHPGASLF